VQEDTPSGGTDLLGLGRALIAASGRIGRQFLVGVVAPHHDIRGNAVASLANSPRNSGDSHLRLREPEVQQSDSPTIPLA
jgi:hypothetical protein